MRDQRIAGRVLEWLVGRQDDRSRPDALVFE
jgi:hypothetical protein